MKKNTVSRQILSTKLFLLVMTALHFIFPIAASAGWVSETIDSSADDVGQYSSIAADSAGNLHISYYDLTNVDLKYVSKVSGTWGTPRTIDYGKFGVGSHSSIDTDSSNNVHISQYYDKAIIPFDQSLRVISKISGTWGTPENIDNTSNNIGQYTSIAVDSLNNIHISYYDPSTTGGDVKYISRVSGVWGSSQYVDSMADNVGQYTSIATDSNRKAHISYYDITNTALKYATNATGSWVRTTIDNTASVGQYTSIAVDSANKVHISYYDATNSSLKYATDVSGSWVITTVDNSGIAGSYTSIALDSSGRVHISYYNSGAGDLKYATNKNIMPSSGNCTSTNFYCETVDAPQSASVGQYTSIEILSGMPNISYYDVTNGNLKYAYYACTDNDGDGYGSPGHTLCTNGSAADCNDGNSSINPGAAEVWYDGIDKNCDGWNDYDRDKDTYVHSSYSAQAGGTSPNTGDCNDTHSAIKPGAAEIWYDGTDQNCDGANDYDQDGDGYSSDAYGGTDCNDTNISVSPGAIEFMCDSFDQNCNGLADDDVNTDGDPVSYCYGDCNDSDNAIYPGAAEICDTKNNDCNAGTADGFSESWYGGLTSCGTGSCASTGQFICTGGARVDTCSSGTPVTEGPVGDATCSDAFDNDCDGVLDGIDGGCFSSNGETYEFDRMWPALQQPWYFNAVSGVATDSNGYVYVSDQMNNKIKVFTSNGQLVTQWGSQCEFSSGGNGCIDPDGAGPLQSGDGQFDEPWGIEVDREGFVYVIDYYNSRIQKFTSDGQFITKWGSYCNMSGGSGCVDPDGAGPLQSGDGQFYFPTGIAVDTEGDVYIIEQGNNRIQKFSSDGQFIAKWGSYCQLSAGSGCVDPDGAGPLQSGDGQFWWPARIEIDNSNFVYAADTNNHRVQKFTTDGQFVTKWGSYCKMSDGSGCVDPDGGGPLASGDGQFDYMYAVGTDDMGNIYVSDYNSRRIQKFTSDGQFITKWGGGSGLGDGQLEGTTDIAVEKGVVYASSSLDRIQKFKDDGRFIDRWGSGNGDGEFVDPEGIAIIEGIDFDAVYVSELNGNRIQRFSLDGQFEGKWGSYCQISSGSGCVDPDGAGPLQTGDGQFLTPRGIAANGNSHVFVIDSGNNRVQKFNENGTFISKWGSSCQISNGSGCVDPDSEGPLQSGDGQFYSPMDTAVDEAGGYVYVADSGNNRIQKFGLNGNFISRWGSYGSDNGQFNWPSGVAVDDSGYVYVVDTLNNRVQRFTGDGVFLSEWGSLGGNEGEFDNPRGIATDGNGYIYVADRLNDRVQVFTPDGVYITKFGETGSAPGQFSQSRRLKISSDGMVYVSDSSRVQVFKTITVSSNNKAIVVAGGGPYAGNRLWKATQMNANFAYMTLNSKGFGKERIYYLTPDTDLDLDNNGVLDDVDGDAANANLQAAVNWASDAENVFVYLVDHGGSGTFRMSGTETLSVSQLDAWLDAIQCSGGQGCITGNVTVIYDACESGSFLSALAPPSGKERIFVSSTSTGESSYFVNQGSVSFSSFFWTNVFNGSNVKDAFDNAAGALTTVITSQTPQLEDGTADGSLAAAAYIGNGTIISGNVPSIGSVSATVPEQSSATLTADNVTDSDGIARVWAVLLPPNYTQSASNNTVNGLPSVDLMPAGTPDRYQATYDQFNIAGTYNIAIYAKDRTGNTSVPSTTTVTVGNPLRERAIIVAGGSQTDANWDGIQKGARAAYDAMRFQGYSDNDIYFTSPVSFTAGIDGTSTLSNLQYAVETWGADSTQDVVLYMAGNGDSESFQINGAQALTAADLDSWLDDLQGSISGKVTVIYDASYSGAFNSALAGANRILIASSGGQAYFLSDGDISFSNYFWKRILNGWNVRDGFLHARSAMQFSTNQEQVALIDDNGNGIYNESSDGAVTFNQTIGAGIGLAGNDPLIGTVVSEITLNGETSALIWAKDVTTTGTIDSVWAVVTSPLGPAEESAAQTIVPMLMGSNRYEGTTADIFTSSGHYEVTVYAKDDEGNISAVSRTTVNQLALTDAYEDDDTYEQANVIFINHPYAQQHNFDIEGDQDWVKFYGSIDEKYDFRAANVGLNSSIVMDLYHESDLNTAVEHWIGGGAGAGVIHGWTCPQDGTYYLKVSNSPSTSYGNDTGYDLEVYIEGGGTEMPGIITGYVYVSGTNVPIEGAIIQTGNGRTAISKLNGYYSISNHNPGTWSISVSKSEYNPGSDSVIVKSLVATPKDLYMTPACTPAAEVCDGIDNDCDGLADDYDPDVTDQIIWHPDSDGDGYGSASVSISACIQPSGYVPGDTDCDDSDQYIYPGGPEMRIVESPTSYYWINEFQTAYNDALDLETIQGKVRTYAGNLAINQNKTVIIEGGYTGANDCGFTSITGRTTVNGNVTISNGTVKILNGTLEVQ